MTELNNHSFNLTPATVAAYSQEIKTSAHTTSAHTTSAHTTSADTDIENKTASAAQPTFKNENYQNPRIILASITPPNSPNSAPFKSPTMTPFKPRSSDLTNSLSKTPFNSPDIAPTATPHANAQLLSCLPLLDDREMNFPNFASITKTLRSNFEDCKKNLSQKEQEAASKILEDYNGPGNLDNGLS